MAAYTALTHGMSMSATALAGPVLKQRSSKMISLAPSPSLLPHPPPSPRLGSSEHRPNKAELETRLAGAHARAYTRRLREALTLGRGTPSAPAASPRTTRAVASSFPIGDASVLNTAPSANTTTAAAATTNQPYVSAAAPSPFVRSAFPEAGNHSAFQCAPSPSMLPPPPPSPRPLFPRRRSRAFVRSPVVGLGLSFGGASLSFPEDDAPLSPHHVYPDTLRRTPGAPLFAKEAAQESAAGTSYFHLPADIMSPAHDGRGQQAFGLGILDLGRQTGVQQPFPVLL